MNDKVIADCELLVRNKQVLEKAFKWDIPAMSLAGSSFYVGRGLEADAERLKECEKILRANAGLFSEYRGNVKMPLLCKMAAAPNAEAYLSEVKEIEEMLKVLKWKDAEYKVLAAMILRDHCGAAQAAPTIEKLTAIYQGMKEQHKWLTGSEDIPFAALLAVSGLDTDAVLAEAEACYHELGKTFHDKDALQSLSHVMAVDPAPTAEKCARLVKLFELLKEQKHKFGTSYELAVLGTMLTLDVPEEELAAEIIEADEFLETQKGFGNFIMGKEIRRMYAALMVLDAYLPAGSQAHDAAVSAMLTIVITIEICMFVIMTSSTTAMVSSSN